MLLRVVIGGLLMVHGFAHLRVWAGTALARAEHAPHRSWLVGDARPASTALAVLAGGLLIGAGAGYPLEQVWWAYAALSGSAVSIALMALVFNRWFVLGLAIDALVVALALRDIDA